MRSFNFLAHKKMRTAVKIDRRSSWLNLKADNYLQGHDIPRDYTLELITGLKSGQKGGHFFRNFGHAWIRFLTPKGESFSVGYFPDESMNIISERLPALRFPAMLLHPDKYDRAGYDEVTTRIPLSEARFNELVLELERDQLNRLDGSLPFSLIENNCVSFVVNTAAKVGVEVEANCSLLDAVTDSLPFILKIVILKVCGLLPTNALFNLGLYILGGGKVKSGQWVYNKNMERQKVHIKNLEPIFTSFTDVMTARINFHHIRALRNWQIKQRTKG